MKPLRVLAPLAPVALAFSIVASPASAAGLEQLPDTVEKVEPATVSITVKMAQPPQAEAKAGPDFKVPPGMPKEFFDHFKNAPKRPAPSALGSGFVVDGKSCYIVTNNHVAGDAAEIKVTFPDGKTYPAELVGTDKEVDLAVLKCNADGAEVPHVDFGDSDTVRKGQSVFAVGNPFGLNDTVTLGIISALKRDIGSGPFDSYLQTDAAINRGNSGGALFDLDGKVVGINTAIYSPSGSSAGLGFAIPANLAKEVVAQIIDHGYMRRGGISVQIRPVSEETAKAAGLTGDARGALIDDVLAGGPAANAGMQKGDIILKVNGKDIQDPGELIRAVASLKPGEQASFTYLRKGEESTVNVTVGERPRPQTTAQGEAKPSPGEMPNPGFKAPQQPEAAPQDGTPAPGAPQSVPPAPAP